MLSNSIRFFKCLFMIGAQSFFATHLMAQVSPFQSGAYLPGIIGVRDYSYPEFEGLTLVDYNLFVSANELTDENGDPLAVNEIIPGLANSQVRVNASGYINSLMISYASKPIPWLGNARYMGWINPSLVTVNVRVKNFFESNAEIVVQAGDSGFGDLNVAPLFLSWRLNSLDITAGYLFAAPTGRYETGTDDNIGVGFWSHVFQAAAYYYLNQGATALMFSPMYEIHSEIKDADVRSGSRFALEYGVSQYVTERLELTVQGGHVWQSGTDTGADVYWDTAFKDRMSTIGVGLGYWFVPDRFYGNLKGETTYATRQNFVASVVQLQLIYTIPFN